MSERVRVTLDIGRDELAELLRDGDLCYRLWLHEPEQGVYTLHARTPGNASGYALLRALLASGGPVDDEPPLPEADEETADYERRWTALLDDLPTVAG